MTAREVPRRHFLLGAAGIGIATMVSVKGEPIIDVRDHGAKGNGKANDTKAIQSAINEASKEKGTVRFPKGKYRCGTVRLRNNTTILITAGATLVLSQGTGDFLPRKPIPHTGSDFETSDFQNACLYGKGVKNITIAGKGTIDGASDHRYGPKPIALFRCKNVTIDGITIRNAANYCISLGGCEDVTVSDVTIRDAFSDGIDPDCCKGVKILDCDVESDDDAVVLKTSLILGKPSPTEDVVVSRCRLNSPSNGFKIGTETSGDVRNVRVEDCEISGTPREGADPLGLTTAAEGGGVAVESVDGAVVEDIEITNCTVDDCAVPIFVRLGARGRGQDVPAPGAIRNVTVSNLQATKATDATTISGVPGHLIEDLTLQDITVEVEPSAPSTGSPIPELEAEYPQAGMFGPLPASGVYVRHASDVKFQNFTVNTSDTRPKLVSEDVTDLTVDPSLA